jgi:hypothetical protein
MQLPGGYDVKKAPQMRLDKTRLVREELDLLGGESPGMQIYNQLRPT